MSAIHRIIYCQIKKKEKRKENDDKAFCQKLVMSRGLNQIRWMSCLTRFDIKDIHIYICSFSLKSYEYNTKFLLIPKSYIGILR